MLRNFLSVSVLVVALVLWMALSGAYTGWAKEPATPELTLEKAIEMAVASSKSVKSAELAIERKEETRGYAADKVRFIPAGPNPDPEAAAAFTGLVMADINWQTAKKSYNAEKDAVAMSVTKAYYEVLKALEGVQAAELSYKSAELSRQVALASYRAGMLAKSGLIQAESGLAQAKGALEAARKALDDAYQQFNVLVGLWPEDRPVLVDRPSFTPLQVDNLEAEVERAVEESPSLWSVKRSIDLAKLNLDLYVFNNPQETEPYKAKEIKVSEAEVSAAGAEENLRKAVRSTYYGIRQLEENYAGLEQKLADAEEKLRVARIKYEVGMATKQEVVAAEAYLAETKKSALGIVCDHEVLKLAFKKPWAYAGTAGASSGGGSSSASSATGSSGGDQAR